MATVAVVRRPKVYVTIVRHKRADDAMPGGAFIAQSSYVPILPEDLKDSIIDVSTTRRLGDAGTFQLTLNMTEPSVRFLPPDLPWRPSWADAIMPMDIVQVEVEVDTLRDIDPKNPYTREVIMRGFVDYVGTTASFGGGTPQRTVVVTGRDYQKILLSRVYYANGGLPPGLQMMQKMVDGFNKLNPHIADPQPDRDAAKEQDKPGITADFVMQVLYDNFVRPQFEDLADSYDKPTGFGTIIPYYRPKAVELDPENKNLMTYTNPAWNPENDQPFTALSELYDRYSHAPWRELFFDDYALAGYRGLAGVPQGTFLIWRPAPWLDISGNLIQLKGLRSADPIGSDTFSYNGGIARVIRADEIIDDSRSYTDAQVTNFIATYSEIFPTITWSVQQFASALEQMTSSTNPAVIGLAPSGTTGTSSFRMYTWRSAEFHSMYFDRNEMWDSQGKDKQKWDLLNGFVGVWNQRLVDALGHSEMLSSGTVTIRGNPLIHMGHYVAITPTNPSRSPGVPVLMYVEGVDHAIRYPTEGGSGGSFLTMLHVTRGRDKLASGISGELNKVSGNPDGIGVVNV